MKNLEIVHNERRERLKKIIRCVKDGKQCDSAVVVPSLYLAFIDEYKDEHYKSGYSVCINQSNFNVETIAWFRSKGLGTYRESMLDKDEIEAFKKYYSKYLNRVWEKFCSCILEGNK